MHGQLVSGTVDCGQTKTKQKATRPNVSGLTGRDVVLVVVFIASRDWYD